MDRLDINKTGGVKVYLGDLQFIYETFKAPLEAFVKTFANDVVELIRLDECAMTHIGDVYTIEAGWVVFRGEIVYFQGGTVEVPHLAPLYFYIQETADQEESRYLNDTGELVDVIYHRRGVITGEAPAGDFCRWDSRNIPPKLYEVISQNLNNL